MAVSLFKLVISATTNTTTVPTANNFLYANTAAFSGASKVIAANKFTKNNGDAATAIVTKNTNNGFYMLFINGELQQTALYTVTSASLTIAVPGTATFTIPEGAPITLNVTNFVPVSSTTVTS
ncbi:DUF4183 domain-containing protein [Paludicola sp. MB14-C6]|uniref:DUF4183 domain-containing protein n=1 Tax=Paludihabitans sp. MB14-C6 TaxID=3070656 RepID=UPI0027DC431D|nr:DUF4183 domain-containing protein [Paludicola sp. MB14-C6]WMJ24052.1 DUF4183 domain-containing protein [Paludicola sp. MB14-C6]